VKGKLANGVGSQYSHTTSQRGLSNITNADGHTSVASSRLNSRPRRFNLQPPNDIYICRTAPLTSRRCILYIYATNIRTEYFKHAAHSPFFLLQNAVYFIMLSFLVSVLFRF
jgi:hypothetical protein